MYLYFVHEKLDLVTAKIYSSCSVSATQMCYLCRLLDTGPKAKGENSNWVKRNPDEMLLGAEWELPLPCCPPILPHSSFRASLTLHSAVWYASTGTVMSLLRESHASVAIKNRGATMLTRSKVKSQRVTVPSHKVKYGWPMFFSFICVCALSKRILVHYLHRRRSLCSCDYLSAGFCKNKYFLKTWWRGESMGQDRN